MSSLLNLRPQKRTLKLAGGEIEIYPLKISQIIDFLSSHASIVQDYKKGRPIADLILESGPKAIFSVVDMATRSESGTAQKAEDGGLFLSVELGEIVEAVVSISLPGDRLGKLIARVEDHVKGLGKE